MQLLYAHFVPDNVEAGEVVLFEGAALVVGYVLCILDGSVTPA